VREGVWVTGVKVKSEQVMDVRVRGVVGCESEGCGEEGVRDVRVKAVEKG
jgi:hypothetical protein